MENENEKVRQVIISEIKKRGFPVGFLRGEADGDYGIIANSENDFILLGYAEDLGYEEDKPKCLEDLNGIDLMYLLYGTKEKKELDELKEGSSMEEVE